MEPSARSGKVRIPRLYADESQERPQMSRQDSAGSSKSPTAQPGSKNIAKGRSYQACEPCRRKKTKCDGARPICRHCHQFKIECQYGFGKREKAKHTLESLQAKVNAYEQLLVYLSPQLDSADRLAIQKMKATSNNSPTDLFDFLPQINERPRSSATEESSRASGGAGSTGNLNQTKEDLNTSDVTDPSGFMGKNSDVAWIKRFEVLAREAAKKQSPNTSERTPVDHTPETPSVERAPKRGRIDIGDLLEGPSQNEANRHLHSGGALTGPAPGRRYAMDKGTSNDGEPILGQVVVFFHPSETLFTQLWEGNSTYHLDDLNLSIPFDRFGNEILTLPPRPVVDSLLAAYFTTIHRTYPVMLRSKFMQEYQEYAQLQTHRNIAPSNKNRWLAILNLILATGAIFSHMVDATWKGTGDDHLVFFSKARLLSLNNGVLAVPDILQVQAFALAGTYLLASNQTNRAWNYTGLAIRCAQSIGLHLYSRSPSLSILEKEIRVRVWCSLVSLETMLKVMSGRPSAINFQDTNVPMPHAPDEDDLFTLANKPTDYNIPQTLPFINAEEASTVSSLMSLSRVRVKSSKDIERSWSSSFGNEDDENATDGNTSFFSQQLRLARITLDALSHLYSAQTMQVSWTDVEGMIQNYDDRLTQWRMELPLVMNLELDDLAFDAHRQERTVLAFQYHNARLLTNRPCLCKIGDKIADESHASKSFKLRSARACIDSARETIKLLPNGTEVEVAKLCASGPWWALIHYAVSAGVVLMIEMVYDAEHAPELATLMVEDAQKVVKFLEDMGKENLAALRSWETMERMLRVVAPHLFSSKASDTGREDVEDNPSQRPTSTKPQRKPRRTQFYRRESDGMDMTPDVPILRGEYEEVVEGYPGDVSFDNPFLFPMQGPGENILWGGMTRVLFPSASEMAEFEMEVAEVGMDEATERAIERQSALQP